MPASSKPLPEQLSLLGPEPGDPSQPGGTARRGSGPVPGRPTPGRAGSASSRQLLTASGFSYRLLRSSRRTLAIHVRQGRVEVRAPLKAAQDWIQAFVDQKSPWILAKLAEQARREEQKLVIDAGRQVTFLGQARRIEVIRSARAAVELQDQRLLLYLPSPSPPRLDKLFHRWLQQQAREYMSARSVSIARQLGVEAKLKGVQFRKTRSKWGHCQRDGTIQYNWLVMMAPREVVDYLIAHECSHLRHMNHSKAFWDTVASVCPDWKARRQWLKEHGHRLWTEL